MDRERIIKGADLIHEALDHISLKAPGDLLVLKLLGSILGITVPLDQLIVSPVILLLLYDRGGIFRDQLPRELRDDLQLGLSVIKMLIDDVAAKNPDMGKIIRLLADGYQKKEILEIVKLNKGKTQGYAFIEKAQSLAKEIYLNNYC